MRPRKEIPSDSRLIRTKSEALNYCLLECPKRNTLGCAFECKIRKQWGIPPHGDKYYG